MPMTSIIDFEANNNQIVINGDEAYYIKNLDIRNGTDSNGTFDYRTVSIITLEGCLFLKSHNSKIVNAGNIQTSIINRCIIAGNGDSGNTAQNGLVNSNGIIRIKDSAIYNCGNNGLVSSHPSIMDNLNLGVELTNEDDSLTVGTGSGINVIGRDINIDDTNGGVLFGSLSSSFAQVLIENNAKILNAHKTWNLNGTHTKVDADGVGDHPNQRGGGASTLIEIIANLNTNCAPIDFWAYEIFCHEYDLTIGSKTIKYYLQNLAAINASDTVENADIWLEAEYIVGYDDTSEYVDGRSSDSFNLLRSTSSNNPIPIRADADDWGEYIEITLNPAVASRVRIRCKQSYYDATSDEIFVDPKAEIS